MQKRNYKNKTILSHIIIQIYNYIATSKKLLIFIAINSHDSKSVHVN